MKEGAPIDLQLPELNYLWQPALSGRPSPYLMIVLHGRGDSLYGFTWLQQALGIPSLNYLLLNAPDPYYGGYSWYDLPPHQLPGIKRSCQTLNKVFTQVQKQSFSYSQIFLLGFSQGSLLTLEFTSRFPHSLAGAIGISGYCYEVSAIIAEKSQAALKTPWLITHGLHDDVLPVERTQTQIKELIKNGFPIDYREYDKHHTIDETNELADIRNWLLAIMEKRGEETPT